MRFSLAIFSVATLVACTPPSSTVRCSSDADCAVGRCLEEQCIVVPGEDSGAPGDDDAGPGLDAGRPAPDDAGQRDGGAPDAGAPSDGGAPNDDGGAPDDGGVDPDDGGVPGDGFDDPFIDDRFNQRARIRLIVPLAIPSGAHMIPVRLSGLQITVPNQVLFYNEDQSQMLPFEYDDNSGNELLYWVRVSDLRQFDARNAIWIYYDRRPQTTLPPSVNPWSNLWELVLHDSDGNANGLVNLNERVEGVETPSRLGTAVSTGSTEFAIEATLAQGNTGTIILVFDSTTQNAAFGTPENIIDAETGELALFVEPNNDNDALQVRLNPDDVFCGQIRSNNPTTYALRWGGGSANCYRDNFAAPGANVGSTGGLFKFFQGVQHTYRIDEVWVTSRQLTDAAARFQTFAMHEEISIVEFAPISPPPGVVPRGSNTPEHEWVFGNASFVADTGNAGTINLSSQGNELPAVGEGFAHLQKNHHFRSGSNHNLGTCVDDREFTLEAWVMPDNTINQGPARIFQHGFDSSNLDLMLGQELNEFQARIRVDAEDNLPAQEFSVVGGQVTPNAVQHLTLVHNGDVRQLFVNAEPVDVDNTSDALDFGNFEVTIGDSSGNDRQWFGAVYYIAIYCSALSSGEIEDRETQVRAATGF